MNQKDGHVSLSSLKIYLEFKLVLCPSVGCLSKLVDIFTNKTSLFCVLKGNQVHLQFFCAHIFRLQLMGNRR